MTTRMQVLTVLSLLLSAEAPSPEKNKNKTRKQDSICELCCMTQSYQWLPALLNDNSPKAHACETGAVRPLLDWHRVEDVSEATSVQRVVRVIVI